MERDQLISEFMRATYEVIHEICIELQSISGFDLKPVDVYKAIVNYETHHFPQTQSTKRDTPQ